ncbi:hypothetical protein MPER_12707 [Moniliophthora perniciosa FA553]|nr:hypothetical protein MPER_12707 [Moniliophthora perniciosa FA553]
MTPVVLVLTYHVIGLVCHTLFYGIYATLTPISTYFMLKKGLKTTIRKLLFIAILFMFVVSTTYWVLKIVALLSSIQTLNGKSSGGIDDQSGSVEEVFAALALVNYVLTDGVVLWRAWVLCSMESKRLLLVPLFFLVCCSFSVMATIVIRIILEVTPIAESPERHRLTRAIDVCQVSNLIFSLIINLSTTLIIAMKTWRFRRWIAQDLWAIRNKSQTGGERILVLLIESGLFYCISGATVLVSSLIRLPLGTLGDIYTPVNIQIAGIYPIVVLLLVSQGKSLDPTVFNTTDATSSQGVPEPRIPQLMGQ